MIYYCAALLLTLSIEVPIALGLLLRCARGRVLVAAVGGNLVSHPLLHFGLPILLAPSHPGPFLLVGELGVLLLEAGLYLCIVRPRPWTLALVTSSAANLASYLVGYLLLPGPA
ncbi:MAG: hypothetical protein JW797_08645 [Bradymonadales bacterium]|nr:hypothetical protein [Bradymonadales bacterium]